ncbi:MAG: putative phosphatase regulatory subunit-domain-containing protein, partial [Olpidium bornovanus]
MQETCANLRPMSAAPPPLARLSAEVAAGLPWDARPPRPLAMSVLRSKLAHARPARAPAAAAAAAAANREAARTPPAARPVLSPAIATSRRKPAAAPISVSGAVRLGSSWDASYCYTSSSLEAEPSALLRAASPISGRLPALSSSAPTTGHFIPLVYRRSAADVRFDAPAKNGSVYSEGDKALETAADRLSAAKTSRGAPPPASSLDGYLIPPCCPETVAGVGSDRTTEGLEGAGKEESLEPAAEASHGDRPPVFLLSEAAPAHAEFVGCSTPVEGGEVSVRRSLTPSPAEHTLRKDSVSLRPALRKTKSMPCLLEQQQRKSVKFEDKYEHVRLFLKAETPSSVVNVPTHIGPDPARFVGTIVAHNIPPFTTCYHGKPVLLESVSLSSNGCELRGVIQAVNYAYEKQVWVRCTVDDWRTQKDVPARFKETVLAKHGNFPGVDRFEFSIHVCRNPAAACDEGWTETSTCFLGPAAECRCDFEFAIRYHVAGGEYWDNNADKNYKIRVRRASTLLEAPERTTNAYCCERASSPLAPARAAALPPAPRRVTIGFGKRTPHAAGRLGGDSLVDDIDPDEIPVAIKRPEQRAGLYRRYDFGSSLKVPAPEESRWISAPAASGASTSSSLRRSAYAAAAAAAAVASPVPIPRGTAASSAAAKFADSPPAGPRAAPVSRAQSSPPPCGQPCSM